MRDPRALSQAVTGTREIIVSHHAECPIGRFKLKELADKIAAATGHHFDEALSVFEDPNAAVAQDVGRLRLDMHLAHRDKIRGFLDDLAAKTLTEVKT